MIPPLELMSKLGLKSGERLWLINAPRQMAEELAAGAEVEMVHETDEYDGVIAFFESEAEAEMMMPRIVAEMPPEGRLWVGGTEKWSAVGEAGWAPVEEIGLGEGLSLQRYEKR
jgi:hypothetical protein